jgi:predicted transcriptional regulator
MCQAEVEKLLTKNKGKWMNASEIAGVLKMNKNTISTNLRKLRTYNKNLQIKIRNAKDGGYLYRIK